MKAKDSLIINSTWGINCNYLNGNTLFIYQNMKGNKIQLKLPDPVLYLVPGFKNSNPDDYKVVVCKCSG